MDRFCVQMRQGAYECCIKNAALRGFAKSCCIEIFHFGKIYDDFGHFLASYIYKNGMPHSGMLQCDSPISYHFLVTNMKIQDIDG